MSISINTFKSCYIVGIGGSGMSSIAKYLFQKGLEVSGYDQRSSYVTNLLNNDGIKVDFDISNATYSSETLYIVSSAINIESTFLSDFVKQPNVLTRPDFLKLLSASVDVIGITGTHGKTSTTALLAHMFKFNDIDISYIYGGVTSFNGIGGHYGDKNLPLILETDEAFNTFKDIQIKNLLVTNIDHDHIDYFGSFENLVKAFKHVISNVEGKCVINVDDDQLSKLIRSEDISYSSSKDSNYKLNSYSSFLFEGNKFKIKTRLIGDHFISNIIGAIALANLNGLSIEQSLNAIEHFTGVKRRTEFIGELNGIILLMAPRIPRKKGQPARSKKHSDLYTDENPKGTIRGLKFATTKDAESSVRKIKASGRTHAHKIQAAIAMDLVVCVKTSSL